MAIGEKQIRLLITRTINLGLIYIVISLELRTSNAFNMLAGFNGLEAGQELFLLQR